MPFAHERWFEFGDYASDWGFAGETLTLVLLVYGSDPRLRPAVSSLWIPSRGWIGSRSSPAAAPASAAPPP